MVDVKKGILILVVQIVFVQHAASNCCGPLPGYLPLQSVPCGVTLASNNLLLPAASPVSALANPVSALYPAILPCGCSSCTYSKEIPIPPPFI